MKLKDVVNVLTANTIILVKSNKSKNQIVYGKVFELLYALQSNEQDVIAIYTNYMNYYPILVILVE